MSLPTFNLLCNIWRDGIDPRINPPALTSICNLQFGRKSMGSAAVFVGYRTSWMCVLLPPLTDVRAAQNYSPTGGDTVEVPAGSGRYYFCGGVDDVSKGFSSEYRVAAVQATTEWGLWPTPIP